MMDYAKSPLVVLIFIFLAAGTEGTFFFNAHYKWSTWDTWSSCHVDCSVPATLEHCRTRDCIDTHCNQVVDKYHCGVYQDHVQFQGCSHSCLTAFGLVIDAASTLFGLFLPGTTKACQKAVDGGWGNWKQWSSCSQTCGDGSKTRQRSCDSPSPKDGGAQCAGTSSTSTQCHMTPCPIDGGWGSWKPWSSCDVTCGVGLATRTRVCDNPVPQQGGRVCQGGPTDAHVCNMSACPVVVDGGWGTWQQWSDCSGTCGLSMKTRQRSCDHPAPMNGGKACVGSLMMPALCNLPSCPVDGGWGDWQAWSSCSQTCGDGPKTRQRSCDSPSPEHGGAQCAGNSTMSTQCHVAPCPIDGDWGSWKAWSSCDVTCGTGTDTRTRVCDNPAPQNSGRACHGFTTEARSCNMPACSIDGGWSQWTNWTDCGVVCGDGHTVHTRTCSNPAPSGAGANCAGPSKERQLCNKGNCTNVTTICKDADLLQMTSGSPSITDPTQSPYTVCHSKIFMQEMLLGKMCKAKSHAADWKLGTELLGDCGSVPLYSPVALVDKQTHDRTYGILLDCYNDVIQIIDVDCRMKVQVVPLDHASTDYYMLLM